MASSKSYSLAVCILAASWGSRSGTGAVEHGFVTWSGSEGSAAAQRAQKKTGAGILAARTGSRKMAEQLKKLQGNLEKNAVTMSESERQKREREFGDVNGTFSADNGSSTRIWRSGARRNSTQSSNAPTGP